jgi:hypothetical protein
MGRVLGGWPVEKSGGATLESNGNWANIDERERRVMEIDRTRSLLTGDKFAVIGRTSVMGLGPAVVRARESLV